MLIKENMKTVNVNKHRYVIGTKHGYVSASKYRYFRANNHRYFTCTKYACICYLFLIKNLLITCSAVLRHYAWTEKIVSLIITPHAVRVMLFLYSCIFMMARRKHELSVKIPSKIRRAIKLAAVRCVDATHIAARRDALTPTCWTSAGRINQRERPPEYPLPQTLGKVSRVAPKEIPHEGGIIFNTLTTPTLATSTPSLPASGRREMLNRLRRI